MMMNSRSTAERMGRSLWYFSRSTSRSTTLMASQASTMSARYAAALRGIQHLLRALDVAGDVAVLDRSRHDEVDVHAKQRAELVQHVEVRLRLGVWVHGSELHEEIDVALTGTEVVAQR